MNRFTFRLFACTCIALASISGTRAFGENENPPPAKPEIRTGIITDFPIDTKLFASTKEYFKDPIPQKIYRAFKDGKLPEGWEVEFKIKLTPEECMGFKPNEITAIAYVPEDYDGKQPYGLYVHVSPSQVGIDPGLYRDLMKKTKMIYVSGNSSGNDVNMLRRIAISVDAMASVMAHYNIDKKRVIVGGLSGGGHIAMFCQMMYPQYFQGAVSHAAQSYLPSERRGGHFPGLDAGDVKKTPRMDKRWVVISGDKDQNYQEIIDTSKDWNKEKFKYLFIDVPGMGHDNASPEKLEEAFNWIFEGYKNTAKAGKKK